MGLFDRGYMRDNRAPRSSGGDAGASGMRMLFTLIGINAGMFFLTLLSPDIMQKLVLTSHGIRSFQIYQLVTSGFLHADFWHFFVNMWGLYMFGGLIAPHIGGKRFLWLYLIGAISGNVLFLLFHWSSPVALLGASGAVFAVLGGAAMFEPERRFFIFPLPMPLRTRTLAICYIILELLMQFSGRMDGVAHLAHLGGILGGYLFLKFLYRNALVWDPFRRKPQRGGAATWQFRGTPEPSPGSDSGPVGARELDALLDKVSRHGINSLSEQELARLRQAREEMRGPRSS